MSIKHVILGYLSWRPMTGYDVKKLIANSEALPWSANNNQIYRALVRLHEDGWVTKRVESQDGAPPRHVYTVTDAGLAALKAWVMDMPQAPITKNDFLDQLLWADCLSAQELDAQLDAYLNAVGEKLFFIRVQADQKQGMPERTPREAFLWDAVHRSWIMRFEAELAWVRRVREELAEMERRQAWTQSLP